MDIKQLQEFQKTARYKTLVAQGANCFISVRDAHGPLAQRILQELPIEEFFDGITKVDDADNAADGISSEDLMHFTVSVESMLKHFTDNIRPLAKVLIASLFGLLMQRLN
ncbi:MULTISPECIES: hypothetical protein [Acinetobacter]|uniref:Uncharacterized protein n=1 Tax=Acinetobacter indicus TaxID=756892 RepID=A0A6C0Y7H3_9GAMM|nr:MULTISPECIES: hypothetical protein [Acinetobacter]QIC72086.1 hypothetical protein FSC09_17155 [Acinetobacter indicus]QKQ71513.1 hypothetical protein E5Y90_14875 [Acinetobacter sp. 10FS3-1]